MKPQDHQTERSERGRPEEITIEHKKPGSRLSKRTTSKSGRGSHRKPLLLCVTLRDSKNSTSSQAPPALRDNRNSTARPRKVPDAELKAMSNLGPTGRRRKFWNSSCGCHQPNCQVLGVRYTSSTVNATFHLPESVKDRRVISMSPASCPDVRQAECLGKSRCEPICRIAWKF